jgi:uncharacterized protein YodC (DUF2158 family)
MKKFKTGDRVQLKSGGEVMTVHSYYSDKMNEKQITCNWFVNMELKSFGFLEDQLELVK